MMEHADTFVTGRKPRLERDGTGVIKWLEKARDGGLVSCLVRRYNPSVKREIFPHEELNEVYLQKTDECNFS